MKKIHDSTTGDADADIARSAAIQKIEKTFTTAYVSAANYGADAEARKKWYETDATMFMKANVDKWFF